MPVREVRATMTQTDRGWIGRLLGADSEVSAPTRATCLSRLRRAAGEDAVLTVEVSPALVGVAEAAVLLGWDRRRVITYVDRGSFPEPLARLASGRVWRRDDVAAFARARRSGGRQRGETRVSAARVLVLIRHGHSDETSGELVQTPRGPQWDPPLDARGREQSELLARRLLLMERPAAVYCSPLRRARETVAPFAERAGIEVRFDDDLMEANVGAWENRSFEEILASDPELLHLFTNQRAIWHRAPDGEAVGAFRARVERAIGGILERHPQGDVFVVTHGGVINAYLGSVVGAPQEMFFLPENTSLNSLEIEDGVCRLRFLNDVLHLTDPHLFLAD